MLISTSSHLQTGTALGLTDLPADWADRGGSQAEIRLRRMTVQSEILTKRFSGMQVSQHSSTSPSHLHGVSSSHPLSSLPKSAKLNWWMRFTWNNTSLFKPRFWLVSAAQHNGTANLKPKAKDDEREKKGWKTYLYVVVGLFNIAWMPVSNPGWAFFLLFFFKQDNKTECSRQENIRWMSDDCYNAATFLVCYPFISSKPCELDRPDWSILKLHLLLCHWANIGFGQTQMS